MYSPPHPNTPYGKQVRIFRLTLKSLEDGQTTVSMGLYATALYVSGLLDRVKELPDIAFDLVDQAINSAALPKRIVTRKK